MITTQWLENLVKRNISNYEERVRTEARAEVREQARAEARDQARDQILSLLDEDTRKDIERKLHHNHHPENAETPPHPFAPFVSFWPALRPFVSFVKPGTHSRHGEGLRVLRG